LAALSIFPLHRWLGNLRTGILVSALALFVFGVNFGGREVSSGEASASLRIDAWSDGLNLLKAKPLFGVGYGNFLDHHERTAHNSFVLCFAELGLLGYFLWMGLIVIAYLGLENVLRHPLPSTPEGDLASILRTSLVAFLVCAWFLSRTYQPSLYILLALCISTWQCDPRIRSNSLVNEAYGAIPRWQRPTLLMMFASIATVYLFVAFRSLDR
jgi:O-antigen ligase